MREQYASMGAETLQEPSPVEVIPQGAEQVRHVGAVKAFTLHDERLLPDELLRRTELDRHAEHLPVAGMSKPGIVDGAETVAGAENDIQQRFAVEGLSQPVRKSNLGPVAGTGKCRQRGLTVDRSN